MKLLKFPISTHIIRAVCDCGTEFQYTGFLTHENVMMIYVYVNKKMKEVNSKNLVHIGWL